MCLKNVAIRPVKLTPDSGRKCRQLAYLVPNNTGEFFVLCSEGTHSVCSLELRQIYIVSGTAT